MITKLSPQKFASWFFSILYYYDKPTHCIFINILENSSSDGDQQIVVEPYYLQLFWSCQDDCAYDCMWHTVSVFQKQGWGVPQFFGRVIFKHYNLTPRTNVNNPFLFQWPFVRVLGLQEPASVVFSLFNLVANLKMLTHFQSKVHKSVPCYYLWTTYSWVKVLI